MPVSLLYLGSARVFSCSVLRGLIGAGVPIEGVVITSGSGGLPRRPTELSVYRPNAIDSVCDQHAIPLTTIGNLAGLQEMLGGSQGKAPVILSVCFPMTLPCEITAAHNARCLNIHPSLLPAYRGPAPLFWQLHAGERHTGVTLHHMSEVIDGGDIAAQSHLALPLGIGLRSLEERLAHLAVGLVADGFPNRLSVRTPQNPLQASYFVAPGEDDFFLDCSWSVIRAYGFIKGTRELGVPFTIDSHGTCHRVTDVLSYHVGVSTHCLPPAGGRRKYVELADGSLEVSCL